MYPSCISEGPFLLTWLNCNDQWPEKLSSIFLNHSYPIYCNLVYLKIISLSTHNILMFCYRNNFDLFWFIHKCTKTCSQWKNEPHPYTWHVNSEYLDQYAQLYVLITTFSYIIVCPFSRLAIQVKISAEDILEKKYRVSHFIKIVSKVDICIKCQTLLFWGKRKNNPISLSSADLVKRQKMAEVDLIINVLFFNIKSACWVKFQ